MMRTFNPAVQAIAATLAAVFVAILLACGCLSARRAMPANPNGLTARTAAVERMNAQIEREARGQR